MEKGERERFQKTVLTFYKKQGRTHLPWRTHPTPYHVFVSEYMLQQTQVERVIPKFTVFIQRFPNFKALAGASLPDVFSLWQGLGYNRRAKYLRDAAVHIVKEKRGVLPNDSAYLESLPGVGPYTAGAIRAFAFGESEPFIETNIRTVLMYYLFPNKKGAVDNFLLDILGQVRPRGGEMSKVWYAALMDYGAHLKRSGVRLNQSSAHYTKQKPFKNSSRQVRGAIVRELTKSEALSPALLSKKTGFPLARIAEELPRLLQEGMVRQVKNRFTLPR
jgi:A/G-specific adenine glycosylase